VTSESYRGKSGKNFKHLRSVDFIDSTLNILRRYHNHLWQFIATYQT